MEAKEIAEVLDEIGVLLELKGENPFKVRAYQSGARALESLEADLADLIAQGKLADVKGIGKALTDKIEQLHANGRLPFYDNLRASVPQGLLEMLQIPGFGPKKVRKVHQELGIETLAELKAACESGAIAGLSGFGEKTAQNLLRGMENMAAYSRRHIWWDVKAIALPILEGLRELPQVQRAEIAGSFRRGRETVGDLDFIVAAEHSQPVMDWFVSRPEVAEITAHGSTKSSVRFEGGLQADLRVVPQDRFVFALHHFTGSKDHNVQMRQRALARGYSLSEWGLFDRDAEGSEPTGKGSDRPLAVSNISEEADLFGALGLSYIAPELREGMDEIAAGEAGELPQLLRWEDVRGAFHNHTKASDGTAGLLAMANAAAALGWQYLGIADHSKSSFQAHGLSEQRLLEQVAEIRRINEQAESAAWLFAGCEVDILRDGTLDFDRSVLSQLDYVVLSVHAAMSGLSEEAMTQRIIRAMETDTGCFKMLGHPTGRLLLRREGYAVSLRKLIDAAAANQVCIELNCNPWRMDMDWRHWRYALEKGVMCAINPDAHAVDDLRYMEMGILAARKGSIQAADILNSKDLDAIRDLFAAGKAVSGI